MESKVRHTLIVLAAAIVVANPAVWAACCTAPDNGMGTVDFPSTNCLYDHPEQKIMIIDGLPPGTTIESSGPIQDISNVVRNPGGPLGGEVATFIARLVMNMAGTGGLAGFHRDILMPLQCQTHIGPRTPGEPVQSFDTDMFYLQGQLPPGDPDFDLLRITAGTGFGLPSPGHTTLTKQAGGGWAVDSFFDITYRIDFVGAPGGPLGGMSGSTTGTIRMQTCLTDTSGGQNCFNVQCGQTKLDFSLEPIPADFFGPGSEPFNGVIPLVGGNLFGSDTIIERRGALPPLGGPPETVPIELVQLHLQSATPITIKISDVNTFWDVSVGQPAPSPGQMTVTKTHPNGGTFESVLPVTPLLTFTEVGDPCEVRNLPRQIVFATDGPHDWQDTPLKQNPRCDGDGFYPTSTVRMHSPSGDVLELDPERQEPTSKYVVLDTAEHFSSALENGLVEPMSQADWQNYYMQLQAHLAQGPPYPTHIYRGSEVYVYDPKCLNICNGKVVEPAEAGLVLMSVAEGQEGVPESIAFKYRYQEDPDLSSVTITVTVLPPCWINVVSFGMQDINGNIRAWYWNVGPVAGPGTLQCGVPTTININTSVWGVAAANPVAASFVNNPAFDITQVSQLIFDENGTWVASQMVPPPGQTVPRMWNYWYDLIVTPNHSIKTTDPIKWSQPVVEYCPQLEHCCPGVFKGWDEISVREYRPLLADDWECKDDRPITDIHWWGSFVGWMEPNLPVQRPIAFHFAIWTDRPKDPCQINTFSHPDTLIWEYYCYDYQWNFAGYDKDPRPKHSPGSTIATTTGVATLASLTSTVSVVQPTIYDSCFQFYQKLPPEAWFYQEPGACGCCRKVYWFSISAIYPDYGMPLQYPWGWKTRPHYYNDDAVRIYQLQSGNWPPQLGDKWSDGVPVKYPPCTSWDMAFELTTNRECDPNEPQPLSADLNNDGIVNFRDLAIFANQWLTVEQ